MIQRVRCIALLLVAIVAVAGCAGTQSQGEEATPTPLPTPIVPTKPTYKVQRGEVVNKLEFTGRVAPVVEQELFFRTSGYVDKVYVKRNDWVKAGDILAELEVTDLKNQIAQAEAALEVTTSNNEQQRAEAETSLNTAELRLAQMKADDPHPQETIAKVNLERALANLDEVQKAYEEAWDPARDWELYTWRKGSLEGEREGTKNALRHAQWDLQVAEAEYQQARQAVLVHEYNLKIQEQEIALARLRLERLEAGADVEEMRLNVQRLKAQLEDARVTAPFDGQVLSLSLVEGRQVDGYRTVAVLADPSELEVSADLSDKQMLKLSEGMPATISPVANPGNEITGEIRRLPYPYGGGGRTQGAEEEDKSTRVSLDLAALGEDIELGDLMRVTVVLERKQDVLWLPPQAIRLFEGRRFVVVQDADGQHRVDVKVGIQGEDRVEIEEGLTEGQVVIGP